MSDRLRGELGIQGRQDVIDCGRERLFAAVQPASTIVAVNRRGKAIALSTAAVGLVVLVAAGIAGKDWILETWYLRQLMCGSDHEKLYAAEKLAGIRSVRAVPALLFCLQEELRGRSDASLQWTLSGQAFHLQGCLARIGKPALPTLLRAIGDDDTFVAASTLEWVYYRKRPSSLGGPGSRIHGGWCIDPVLRFLRDDEYQSEQVREAAAEALVRLESR